MNIKLNEMYIYDKNHFLFKKEPVILHRCLITKNEKEEKNMNHFHLLLVKKFVFGDGFLLSHFKWNCEKILKYVKPINSNAYGKMKDER